MASHCCAKAQGKEKEEEVENRWVFGIDNDERDLRRKGNVDPKKKVDSDLASDGDYLEPGLSRTRRGGVQNGG